MMPLLFLGLYCLAMFLPLFLFMCIFNAALAPFMRRIFFFKAYLQTMSFTEFSEPVDVCVDSRGRHLIADTACAKVLSSV